MKEFLLCVVLFANYFSIFYVALISFIYLMQLIFASFHLGEYFKKIRYSEHDKLSKLDHMLPISLLVPAYNEEMTIVDNVVNLLDLDYYEYEVIVVNDGSSDKTLEQLKENFELVQINEPIRNSIKTKKIKAFYRSTKYPYLVVVDKENGGKADALNTGINIARYPIFAAIDADSILEKDSLIKLVSPFFFDKHVMAVGGIIRIANGCKIEDGKLTQVKFPKKFWAKLQTVEYLRAFLTGRMGFDAMGMLLIISGAFGAFRKRDVISVGGYSNDCIGEDMELTLKLHKYAKEKKKKYVIKFVPDPICWTQAPEAYGDLRKQRKRWHIGLISSLFNNKKMTLNPKYGRIGMIAIPYFWIFEVLGPVIELLGYILIPVSYLLNIIDLRFMLTFYMLSIVYGIILSIGTFMMEEFTFKKYDSIADMYKMIFYSLVDNFGYRHINNIFKIEGMLSYRKNKTNWGKIKRTSFEESK